MGNSPQKIQLSLKYYTPPFAKALLQMNANYVSNTKMYRLEENIYHHQ